MTDRTFEQLFWTWSSVSKSDVKFHVGSWFVKGGFASIEVDAAAGTLTVVHRDGDGKVLYTAPPVPKRNGHQQPLTMTAATA